MNTSSTEKADVRPACADHLWRYPQPGYRYCVQEGCKYREVLVEGQWQPEQFARWREND